MDVARAVRGDFSISMLDAETFARQRGAFRLHMLAQELMALADVIEPYADQVPMSAVHFAVEAIERACARIRRDVLPKARNDFPPCVRGQFLDVTA